MRVFPPFEFETMVRRLVWVFVLVCMWLLARHLIQKRRRNDAKGSEPARFFGHCGQSCALDSYPALPENPRMHPRIPPELFTRSAGSNVTTIHTVIGQVPTRITHKQRHKAEEQTLMGAKRFLNGNFKKRCSP